VIIAGIFSVIVDETQDLSRHKQVAIILRYVNNDFEPIEAFLDFIKQIVHRINTFFINKEYSFM